jgi:hypothetical protein
MNEIRMEREWVEIRRCTWLHQAELIRSVLESAGLEVLIPNEHTIGVEPLLGIGLGACHCW